MTCQTSIYFGVLQTCSMFSEPCPMGRIVPMNDTSASVICSYQDRVSISLPSNPIVSRTETLNCSVQINSTGNRSRISFDQNSPSVPSTRFINNVSCSSPGIYGHGATLVLSRNQSQNIELNHTFLLANRSFTVMAWVNYEQLHYDMGIVGQCHSYADYSCFHFSIRNQKGYLGFFSKDVRGSRILKSNRWYHIAAVYDSQKNNQSVYIDGYLDASLYQKAYLTFSPTITIGLSLPRDSSYFNGMIDQVSLIDYRMSPDEILQQASLVFYYSFNHSIEEDSGPNQIAGFNANVCLIDGLFNRSLMLCSSGGYFQIRNLMLLGASQYNFTFSFWIYPWLNHTNVHFLVASSSENTSLIGIRFGYNSFLIVRSWNGTAQEIVGPQLNTRTWTHVAVVCSFNTSLTLFINGTHNGSLNRFVYSPNNTLVTVLIGSPMQLNRFHGQIDEFRLYSRALSQGEIQQLSRI